jgi:hypothetical protein
MPLHVSSTRAHHQEAKTVLYSLWYRHTYRWPSHAQVERGLDEQFVAVFWFARLKTRAIRVCLWNMLKG